MSLIETIGIPGSGKSTVIKLLLNSNSRKIYKIDKFYFLKKVRYKGIASFLSKVKVNKLIMNYFYGKKSNQLLGQFLLENEGLLHSILNMKIFQKQEKSDRVFVLQWLLRLLVDYQWTKSYDDKLFVFDEGFLHKSISLFIDPNRDVFVDDELFYTELDSYLNVIPIPSKVVFVEVDVELAFQRLKDRGYTRRTKGNSEKQILTYLEFCNKIIHYVIHFIEERGSEIITINNNQNFSKLTIEVNKKMIDSGK